MNADFVVRKINRVWFVFLNGVRTGTGTEKISAQIMVRSTVRVREFSEMPSTGTEFTT